MMCYEIGRPRPISTMGFGCNSVSSKSRVPGLPVRIATLPIPSSELKIIIS